ncbi:MAG: hypothetical protein KA214_03160 [Neisseriaceae bacterium]|nr:hypothetical protein [Neisseriaceae bacterium]
MRKTFVNEAPGIYLIKAGEYAMNELSTLRNTPELKGQILDLPLANSQDASLTLGYFSLQPSVSYEALFDFIEVKIVTKGKMVVRDEHDHKFVAEVGDVLVFMPNTKVIFDGESDGEAVYFKNTPAVPSYLAP